MAVLEADRTRLKAVEAEMLALERALTLLRTERSTIQGRIDAYKYPVLTLPNEIVSEIFIHFLPAYPDCPSMTGRFSPTFLTQICRKWQAIALTTPALWRAIRFPLRDLTPAQRVHLLKSSLARSCFCPLSIKVDEVPFELQKDLQLLISHHLRWEFLELCIDGRQTLLGIFDGPTPLLRKLNLRIIGYPSSPLTLTEAPLLRTAILNDDGLNDIILPWAQLTSLTLHDVYPEECTPILQQTFSLVHCELNLFLDDPSDIPPDVNLPSLESLILIDLDTSAKTEYLGTFIVPALRKLEVPEAYIGFRPIPQLKSFISKSGCKLEDVYITGRRRSTPDELYRNALPLVPKITFEFTVDIHAVE
ncbi:hypothetical protein C8R43DRAFT_1115594 [Mycena crocata]|nr:hypothetical protein C8R43DRAFT_1115594 [Mycena crocata]